MSEQASGAGPAPGATYTVIATTVIDGNTYTSAPITFIGGGVSFLARVLQVRGQGTYEFDVQMGVASLPSAINFQKTCLAPVTFQILREGRAIHTVVVSDSFQATTVYVDDL